MRQFYEPPSTGLRLSQKTASILANNVDINAPGCGSSDYDFVEKNERGFSLQVNRTQGII
jgi:hypothetical protein